MDKKTIYLNNAETTRLDDDVKKEMQAYEMSSGSTDFAGKVVDQAREKIASLLSVKPNSILFTKGGTESNNFSVKAALLDLKCDDIITSKIEHPSVLNALECYAKQLHISVTYVKLYEDGSVDQNDLGRLLKARSEQGKKCFVTLMHANNETGNFTEIKWVSPLCKRYGAIFHSDCVQTIGHYPLNLYNDGVHMASASAHKFHGPKGVGFLYLNDD